MKITSKSLERSERFPLGAVRLLEPVEVAALFDFGLTPRHLKNSAETMLKYEKDNPQTAPLLQAFARAVLPEPPSRPAGQPEPLFYYKCNMNTIVGDGEIVPWPAYTSRLDIEPELAVVYGNDKQPIAGFCIFNDVSARDVQAPEFIGGFCLSKDMSKGNQLGPYLVTPDEVGDPYNLKVTVTVNGHVKFRVRPPTSATRPKTCSPGWVTMAPIKPGSVIGFGTIPDCTGWTTTTSSTLVPRSRSPSNDSARCTVVSRNRPASCYRVAGRCASHCRKVPTGSP